MPTINEQLDAALLTMADTDTMADSLPVLFKALKDQVTALLAGQVTPDTLAKVDAVFAAATKQKQEIADAIIAGTPDAPTP